MRIYIASKYLEHQDINQTIYDTLIKAGFSAFLPKSIDVNAITSEEMYYVAEICFDEIEKSDVLLIVNPFKYSVTCEIGYAISLKRKNKNMHLILYLHTDEGLSTIEREAMISPYIEAVVANIPELIEHLKTIQ